MLEKLFAFNITQIPLRKLCTPLQFWFGNQARRKKTLNPKLLNSTQKIDLWPNLLIGSCYIYIYIYIRVFF